MKRTESASPPTNPGESASEKGTKTADQDRSAHGVFRKAVTSESFVEKAILLLLTACLTGLLAPLLVGQFNRTAAERQKERDEEAAVRQKELEAIKATNASILQAQSKLIDDAAETILSLETLILDVSWYMQPKVANKDQHNKAFERYVARSVELYGRWRAIISRSQSLASPAISKKLSDFLVKVFGEQDTPMSELVGKNAPAGEWEKVHGRNVRLTDEAFSLIAELRSEMGLSRANLR
jgi:hypothetical protein